MAQQEYLTRTGFVKEKQGNALKVCFQRAEACAACRGCAEGFRQRDELLTVYGDAQPGDVVEVRVPSGRLMQSVLLAFAPPAILFIAGLFAGSRLGFGEGGTALAALAGLALGGGLTVVLDRALNLRLRWKPTVARVLTQTTNPEKEKGKNHE